MGKVNGNGSLSFKAGLDISEVQRNAEELRKILKDLKIQSSAATATGAVPASNTQGVNAYREAQLRMQQSLRDSRLETQRLKQEQQNLRNQFEQGRVSQQTYRTEADRLRAELTALRLATAQARTVQTATNGSYKEAQQRLTALGNEIRNTTGGFSSQTPALRAKIKEYNELNDRLKQFDATMGNHGRNVGNYRQEIKGAASDLLSFATSYLSAGAALQYVFQSTLKFQSIKTPLTYILGSEGDANNKLAELKQLASDLGIEYFALADSYRSFSAAARASNFDLDKSEKIFRSVAKAGAVLHLSSDQMSGALLAIQQMISKGNVQAEELRGQLSERLPGAFSLAAKAMGVTEQELNKLLQTGSVVASDLLPKLADQLDKRYGDKAAGGIHGLNSELNGLISALQSMAGEGKWSEKVFEPIIRGAKNLARELSYVFRGSTMENLKYLLTFSNKDIANQRKAYDLRDTNANNINALQASKKNNISDLGLGDLRTAYTQIDATYKQAVRDYKAFEAGVKNGSLKETNKATVASFFNVAAGLREERKRIATELDKAKSEQVKGNKDIADSALTAVADIRKRITQLQKLSGSADPGSDIAKRIEALQARIKKGGDAAGKAQESALKRQRALQAEIDALTKKGVASKLDADQQEIVSVENKYKKLREKAIAFNNAKDSKGQKVNLSGLDNAETAEKKEITDKSATKTLKGTLDTQAKYYSEFEDLKNRIGEDKAKERYAKLIDTDKTYLDTLREAQEKYAANPFAMKLLAEESAAANVDIQKVSDERYARALQAATTHAQALAAIDREYNENVKALGKDATAEQIANLNRQKAEAIRNANETNAYLKSGYDELMQNFDAMTRGQIRERLEAIKKGYQDEYKAGKLTAEQLANLVGPINDGIAKLDGNNSFKQVTSAIKNYREQVKLLGKDSEGAKEAQKGMFAAMAQGAADINEVLGEVAGSLEQLGIGGEGLQNAFKNVQGAVDGIGKIGKGLATGNPVDVVTGSIKLLTSALGLFNTKDKKLQKQIDGYKDQIDSLSRSYAALDRAVNNSVGESFYTDSRKEIDNLMAQQKLLIAMRDAESKKKKSDKDKIAEYNAQIDEIPNKIADINKAISENLIQTHFKDLSNNLADALAEAFASGEDSAKAFDNVFRGVISNAVKNSLKLKILDPIIKKFTDDLTEYAEGNDNSVIGFDFNAYKDQLKAAGDLFSAGLKGSEEYFKSVGLDAGTVASANGGIASKGITAITQETGGSIDGTLRAQYDITKQSNTQLVTLNKVTFDAFNIAKQNLDVAVQIQLNTLRTANNTDGIGPKLDKIITNTSSQSSRGLTG
jgi:tape measure domain-containing protein